MYAIDPGIGRSSRSVSLVHKAEKNFRQNKRSSTYCEGYRFTENSYELDAINNQYLRSKTLATCKLLLLWSSFRRILPKTTQYPFPARDLAAAAPRPDVACSFISQRLKNGWTSHAKLGPPAEERKNQRGELEEPSYSCNYADRLSAPPQSTPQVTSVGRPARATSEEREGFLQHQQNVRVEDGDRPQGSHPPELHWAHHPHGLPIHDDHQRWFDRDDHNFLFHFVIKWIYIFAYIF